MDLLNDNNNTVRDRVPKDESSKIASALRLASAASWWSQPSKQSRTPQRRLSFIVASCEMRMDHGGNHKWTDGWMDGGRE